MRQFHHLQHFTTCAPARSALSWSTRNTWKWLHNGIPHLLIPVINKPRAAILALKWLVKEMEERYQCLQSLNARNIDSYNEKLAADPEAINRETGQPLDRMPYLVLVIDELADLMLLAAKEIEDSISRLAAMSRAVGIHLIFATQRPSVDVLTGVIKNNFPARIAFQVASTIDSRTILDTKGADKLLGKGDSLFVGPGSPAALRVQGAFLSEAEVEKTADYLRSLGTPLYRMEILTNRTTGPMKTATILWPKMTRSITKPSRSSSRSSALRFLRTATAQGGL